MTTVIERELGLFYPNMRLQDRAWVRSQLLFFDEISTIDPGHGPTEPMTSDEMELFEERALSRVQPTAGAVERASRQMAMLLVFANSPGFQSHFANSRFYSEVAPDALSTLRSLPRDNRGASVRKISPRIRELERELKSTISGDFVRMHPEKMEWMLRAFLAGGDGTSTGDLTADWIDVDPIFANVYMAILAQELVKEKPLSSRSVLTDKPVYDLIYQDLMATTRASQQIVRRAEGIFVDVVLEPFNIRPDTPISKLIDFKKRHSDELQAFRRAIRGLALQCSSLGNLEEIRREAQLIAKRDVLSAVSGLEKSLSGFGILWTRSGLIKLSSLVAGVGGGLATFDFSGSHYVTLSASMAISMTGVALSGFGDRQAAREASPYSYLLSIQRNFPKL